MFRKIRFKKMLKFGKDHGWMKDAEDEIHKVVFLIFLT
jgi:hypothetical protein